jgi:hypothetical protein
VRNRSQFLCHVEDCQGRTDKVRPYLQASARNSAVDHFEIREANCPPESGGQHDRDEVAIVRGVVPKPHPYKVRLGTTPRGIRFAIPLPSSLRRAICLSDFKLTHYPGNGIPFKPKKARTAE